MSFFKARARKGIARNIYVSSVAWTLIDNGKLANQIARLAAIVVRQNIAQDKKVHISSQCISGKTYLLTYVLTYFVDFPKRLFKDNSLHFK